MSLKLESEPDDKPKLLTQIIWRVEAMSNQDKERIYNIAKRDINNLTGNFKTGVDNSINKTMGDRIDTQINNSQDLTQAAEEIKILLDKLSEDYPSDSSRVLGARALDIVEKRPELQLKILRGVKKGSFAALEEMIDHPIAKFFVELAKEVFNS